eukprot:TRINITY_DN62519_c0_g1_i1.p1 TRINITY_DN62519_c0_g1~~TRINITY_DN62519_c0_g1_i1.p1  ORF type:complete len:346 (-),score=44.83 TRINITY_DN62519_c0_g1_i1:37-1074(-)
MFRTFRDAIVRHQAKAEARLFWRVSRRGFPVVLQVPSNSWGSRSSFSPGFLYTLVSDDTRMRAFREAITRRRAERVLEIGCGPWTPLVQMALESGSSEVVAVEASAQHAEVARQNLANDPRVRVVAGRSEDIALPEGFVPELVIAELLGNTASDEGGPAILAQAMSRLGHLASEAGKPRPCVVPKRARSLLSLTRSLSLSRWQRFRNWMAHGGWPNLQEGQLYDCRNIPATIQMGEPQVWEDFDFESPDLTDSLVQNRELRFQIEPSSEVGGLLLWMQADIDEKVRIDTREQLTSWGLYYLHLPPQKVGRDGVFLVLASVDARTDQVEYKFQVGDFTFATPPLSI